MDHDMQVTVSNRIRVDDPSDELREWCKKHLVLPNPAYEKKRRMGFWLGNTPKQLTLYDTDGTSLLLPYGCLSDVYGFVGGDDEIRTDMIPVKPVDYKSPKIPLYDYQIRAATKMLVHTNGILIAPAGSGKTQIGVALSTFIGRKTLWLTHTVDLLTQSKQRAERYIDPDLLGTITAGKVRIGEAMTFATVQTLCRLDLSLYKDTWDVIIVDECHRCTVSADSVTQFAKVLNGLSARHKYGLTATAHRADGLIAATYALLGPVIYEVPKEAVADKIVTVKVFPIETETELTRECLDTDGTLIHSNLINMLVNDKERNQLILKGLKLNRDHYNLILSDRLEHLRYLMDSLPPDLRSAAVMVDGKMTSKAGKAARAKALDDMRTGAKHYLFATYSLAKEGLDIPRLDRLYLTTPQKDFAIVTQSIGRIARAYEGKDEPVCYDYVDSAIPYLLRAYKKRCTSYRKAGCVIV